MNDSPADAPRTVRTGDPFATCAKIVCDKYRDKLPDLSSIIVLLPNILHKESLRRRFITQAQAHGCDALIPPEITTPQKLAEVRADHSVPTKIERHYQLGSILIDHPGLFPGVNRWQLSSELLRLFDELSLREDMEDIALLNDDAQLLINIYRSWCEAVDDGLQDGARLYRDCLLNDKLTRPDEEVFLCGFDNLSPLETAWSERLSAQGHLTRIDYALHGDDAGDTDEHNDSNDYGEDEAFSRALGICMTDAPFRRRTERLQKMPDPIAARVRLFTPSHLEQHVLGIASTVKQWLQDGIKDIAIVTQDRRLARRLRALLADLNIILYDRSGWALSTTASATAVHHLLDDNEPHLLLLKLLRSPFVRWGETAPAPSAMIARVENILLRLECPPTTWAQLEQCLVSAPTSSKSAKTNGSDATISSVIAAVRTLREAVTPLRQFTSSGENAYDDYFAALTAAMETLGMDEALWADVAGERVMEIIAELRQIAHHHHARGTPAQWRDWLGYTLETNNFITPHSQHHVALLSSKQAQLARPRGLILAALDTQHNPVGRSPLITELTAADLGLDSHNTLLRRQREHYYKLLATTQIALLTYENNSNQNTHPHAWIEEFTHLHHSAWGDDLTDANLVKSMRVGNDIVTHTATTPTAPPAPRGQNHIRSPLSASACQTAIRCPYQFFAKYDLGLYEERELPDGRMDGLQFGKKTHRCMAALLSRTNDKKTLALPGPFDQPWRMENRDAAMALATQIVDLEFAAVAGISYINTCYQKQALRYMERYIDYLIQETDLPQSTDLLTETSREEEVSDGLAIRGKMDLIIYAENKAHIIDYKTGNIPSQKSIQHGEDVQLAFYALLEPKAQRLTYINFEKKLEERENIPQLKQQCQDWLTQFKQDYEKGAVLSARGADLVCQHCDYGGLCRKQAWQGDPSLPNKKQAQKQLQEQSSQSN